MHPETLAKLESLCQSWKDANTPYRNGMNQIGVGVDCVRFVDSVLQQAAGLSLPPLPIFPVDTSAHSARRVAMMGLLLKKRFPCLEMRKPLRQELEPGDVLAVRFLTRHLPGHIMIIGATTKKVWHCINGSGVCFTNLNYTYEITRAWRPLI